jgi:xanthine dehydrogenase accessory factor
MDSADLQTLDALLGWLETGRRGVLVTVAATWGSSPRPPGAWAAIRDDGAIAGSVSGGCVEADLVERVRHGDFAENAVSIARYGGTPEESARFGLPCGGTLELTVEGRPNACCLRLLRERLASRRRTVRVLDVADGEARLVDSWPGAAHAWDGRALTTLHGPRLRLLLIGAGQVSAHLAVMAQALDYEVFVCDPREEYLAEWKVPGAVLVDGMPDDVVRELAPDPGLAVVALTHDPRLDDLALLEALGSPAFYVGAIGSRANNQRRRQRLREHFAFDADVINRLRGPVGLPIGSRTPPEIAVSILAELTAAKNGVALAPQPEVAAVGEASVCGG